MSEDNTDQSQPEENMTWEQFAIGGTTITWDEFLARMPLITGKDVVFRGPFGGTWRGPIKKCVVNERGWELVLDWVAEFDGGKNKWLLFSATMNFGLVGFKDMTELGDVEGIIRLRFLDRSTLHYLKKEARSLQYTTKLARKPRKNTGILP